MKKFLRGSIISLGACLIAALTFAIVELNALDEFKGIANMPEINYLEEGWTCIYDDNKQEVTLPGVLDLPEGTQEIALVNTLPSDVHDGDILRMQTYLGWYDIYIDGELRNSYGNKEVTDRYVLENASWMITAKLYSDDAGKEIVIKTGCIYLDRLVLQRAPSLSGHRDLLLSDLIESTSGLLIIIVSLIVVMVLIVIYSLFLLKGQNYSFLLGSGIFLLIMALYYNVCNLFRFELSDYAAGIAMSNDFIYYIAQFLVAPIGYILALYLWDRPISKKLKLFIVIHSACAIGTVICQMLWIDVLAIMELVLGVMSFIGYVWLFIIIKPFKIKNSRRAFLFMVFICEFAVLLDFYKCVGTWFPLPDSWVIYLQVEGPFMIFLPIALMISSAFTIIGVVNVVVEEQFALKNEAESAMLRAKLAEKEYQSTFENMIMIRRVKHDMNHHLTSLRALITAGEIDEAIKHIDTATNMIPKKTGLDGNFITNGFIDYYGSLCKEANISFKADISYNEIEIIDKTGLGIVLGNTIKNAYEGALAATRELRFVEVHGKRVYDQIVIVVTNGYCNEIKPNYESSKGKDRGLGISSVRAVTEDKGGFLDINTKDNVFTVKAVIILKE